MGAQRWAWRVSWRRNGATALACLGMDCTVGHPFGTPRSAGSVGPGLTIGQSDPTPGSFIQSVEAGAATQRDRYLYCDDELPRLGNDLELLGSSRGFRSGGNAELGKDRGDVVLDRSRGEKKFVRDPVVAVSAGQKHEDVDLT